LKAAALLAAALALSCGAPSAPPSPPPSAARRAPALVAEPAAFDFGRLLPGRSVRKEFRLRNLGPAELAVESVTTDCGCVVTGTYARRLPPGGATALAVTLEAPAKPGPVERTVLVRTRGETLALKLRATVVASPETGGAGPRP
jgi:hypothetical protein